MWERLRRVWAAWKGTPGSPLDADYARDFRGSADYWERRYAAGGDSGAGSYEQLAEFKAGVLNDFVAEKGIRSVLELGCGDGNQLGLARYPVYVGMDVASGAIDRCLARFGDDRSKSFFLYDPARFVDNAGLLVCDLAMSLDVLFHLVEDEVFEGYLDRLFASARSYVCIYSSNAPMHDDWPHVRHRNFTDVVATRFPSWRLVQTVTNPYRGAVDAAVADFYFYERSA